MESPATSNNKQKKILLQTDHKPLLYLQNADKLNPRVKQEAIFLNLYTYECTHIKGENNHLADLLSRCPQD